MPSTKNFVTSIVFTLAGAPSVVAPPIIERGLQAGNPNDNKCSKGQLCLPGNSAVSDSAIGLTSFFCQNADAPAKRNECSPESEGAGPLPDTQCPSGEVCITGEDGQYCQPMIDPALLAPPVKRTEFEV